MLLKRHYNIHQRSNISNFKNMLLHLKFSKPILLYRNFLNYYYYSTVSQLYLNFEGLKYKILNTTWVKVVYKRSTGYEKKKNLIKTPPPQVLLESCKKKATYFAMSIVEGRHGGRATCLEGDT